PSEGEPAIHHGIAEVGLDHLLAQVPFDDLDVIRAFGEPQRRRGVAERYARSSPPSPARARSLVAPTGDAAEPLPSVPCERVCERSPPRCPPPYHTRNRPCPIPGPTLSSGLSQPSSIASRRSSSAATSWARRNKAYTQGSDNADSVSFQQFGPLFRLSASASAHMRQHLHPLPPPSSDRLAARRAAWLPASRHETWSAATRPMNGDVRCVPSSGGRTMIMSMPRSPFAVAALIGAVLATPVLAKPS